MSFLLGTLKYLLLPSSLIMVCAFLGFSLLCGRRVRVWGQFLCMLGIIGYMIFAAGPVAYFLLGHLEYEVPSVSAAEREGIRTIVVLAAYAEADPVIPLSSRVNSGTAFRLLEVMSLFRTAPDSMVIVSGERQASHIMRELLVSGGVPAVRVMVDDHSSSTFESGRNLAPTLGTVPFLLVTSAGHMPRAVKVFRKAGTNPYPVPTNFLTKKNWLAIRYLPSPVYLVYSDLAVSEYEAIVWYALKGWI